MLQLMRLDIKR